MSTGGESQSHLNDTDKQLVVTEKKIEEGEQESVARRSQLWIARIMSPHNMSFKLRSQLRKPEERTERLGMSQGTVIDKTHICLIEQRYLKVGMLLNFSKPANAQGQYG